MKKKTSLLCIILALIMMIGVMSGCNLVTKDTERDLNQTVATVQIDNNIPKATILKKDMVVLYLNGYYYYYQAGYTTTSAIYSRIISDLINSKVLIQAIMYDAEVDKKYMSVVDQTKTAYTDIDRYLEKEEIIEAKYTIIKSIDSLIVSYESEEISTTTDSALTDTRTAPTNASAFSLDVSDADMKKYVEDIENDHSILIGRDNTTRKVAYEKVMNLLKVNGLIGDVKGDILDTTYYTDSLKSQKESLLISKFENTFKYNLRKSLNLTYLDTAFKTLIYDVQKANYDNDPSAFVTALDSISEDSPLVYSPDGVNYGLVYNLLVGADQTRLDAINDLTETDDLAKATARKAILDNTSGNYGEYYVQDLRSTWVNASYNYNPTTNQFDGGYSYLYDYDTKENNGLAFNQFAGDYKAIWQNQTIKYKDGSTRTYNYEVMANGYVRFYYMNGTEKVYDDTYTAQYQALSVKMGLDSFINEMDVYLYGATQSNVADSYFDGTLFEDISNKKLTTNEVDKVNVKKIVKTSVSDKLTYEKKIHELLFAYSTDSGSLSKIKGYSAFDTGVEATSSYVTEFQRACQMLYDLAREEDSNASYVITATQYGYHIMFYSQLFSLNQLANTTLTAYLDSEYGTNDWSNILAEYFGEKFYLDAEDSWTMLGNKYYYLTYFIDQIADTSNKLSTFESEIYSKYVNDTSKVVKYTSAYSDLVS